MNKINGTAQEVMDSVKGFIYQTLNSMEDGQKTTLKDLIDKVVAQGNIKVSMAHGVVPMIVHNWANEGFGSINNGRNGGIFKGGKKSRVDMRPRCESCNQVLRTYAKKEEIEE